MVRVSPSLFGMGKKKLVDAVNSAKNADFFHIDVTDGVFVKDKNGGASLFFDDSVLEIVKENTEIPLDVHLMVADPIKHIERYAMHNPEFLAFHIEATDDPEKVIKKIKSFAVKVVVVVNPSTPLKEIEKILDQVDKVLLMSVVPGKGGQKYMPSVTKKIKELRTMINEKELSVLVEVDGGIKLDNVEIPIMAGVDVIVSGTGIFNHAKLSPFEVIEKIKEVGVEWRFI